MNDRQIIVQPSPAVVHVSPFGFNSYAADFLRAGLGFEAKGKFSPVPYYLYCRAIELGLKAFMLCNRVPKKELKHLGHDLIALYNNCQSLGLSQFVAIDNARLCELEKANNYYVSKEFEYFFVTKAAVGYPDLPALPALESLATQLVNDLRQYCIDSA